MSLVAVFVGSIVVLVVVTCIAGKRDAARKAELAARNAPRPSNGQASD